MKEVEKHRSYLIDLRGYSVHKDKSETMISFTDEDPYDVSSDLALAIWHLRKDRKNCPNCGGIVPEITVKWKDREYRFTCYKIVSLKSGKTLSRTDYKRMRDYLSGIRTTKKMVHGT